MILYWFLLLLISIVAYGLGSMSTTVIASNYVFRASLRRLGTGNLWISNFRRIYGIWGWIRLLLVELIKNSLPILFGSLLLGFKGHADVGRAFAGLCVVLGRLYPLFYDFKGSHATLALVTMALWIEPSVGIATAAVAAIAVLVTKYISLGTLVAALALVAVSLLMVEDVLIRNLIIIAAALIFLKHIPAISRMVSGREEKLNFKEDITYKLDENF